MTTKNDPGRAAQRRNLREIGDRRVRVATALVAAASVAGAFGVTAGTLANLSRATTKPAVQGIPNRSAAQAAAAKAAAQAAAAKAAAARRAAGGESDERGSAAKAARAAARAAALAAANVGVEQQTGGHATTGGS